MRGGGEYLLLVCGVYDLLFGVGVLVCGKEFVWGEGGICGF